VPSILSHKKGGKGQEAFLPGDAQQQVAEEVSTGRFRTAEEVRNWIVERYGVTYSKGGMYNLLHRLGCSPKVPRPIHAKANQQQQADWKKGGYGKP
jgi:transposase